MSGQRSEVRGQRSARKPFLVRAAATIGEAIGSGVRGFKHNARLDEWEGAEQTRLRRRPRGRPISEDASLDFGLRTDLMFEARDLCNKQGICNRIIRQYANYVVGDCQPRFLTSDPEWNEQAEDAFYNWSLNCDLRSSITLQDKARKHIMGLVRDGDSFCVKVDFEGQTPLLKDIEADRVGNYMGGTSNRDEDRIVGGIKVDTLGRPQQYLIWERTRFGQFVNVDSRSAAEVLHLYDSTRFDAYRGVTHFAPALNHMRDLKETVAAQKAKQKLTSKLALMVRNAIGGAQASNINLLDDENEKGVGITTEDTGDGMIKYQFNGDEMEAFVANDPSDGWFRLTEHLLREIAVGLDLPYEFIWNMAGLAGPGTRMMSKQAERTFKAKMDILENRFLNPVTSWWVNYEMQPGRMLPFNAEWYKFKFQRPAHISIDMGRDSKSNLDELAAGVSTELRIAEEQGEDPEEVRETRKLEVGAKLQDALDLQKQFPQCTLNEILDLLGRPNIPKNPGVESANLAQPQTAQAA